MQYEWEERQENGLDESPGNSYNLLWHVTTLRMNADNANDKVSIFQRYVSIYQLNNCIKL